MNEENITGRIKDLQVSVEEANAQMRTATRFITYVKTNHIGIFDRALEYANTIAEEETNGKWSLENGYPDPEVPGLPE